MAITPEIPIPSGAFVDWASQTSYLCGSFPDVPFPTEENWREWGYMFSVSPTMQGYQIPSPDSFQTWEEWGNAAKRSFLGP